MAEGARLGGKVRALRRRQGLTQTRMAERLQISASYLNLIEHDKRPLTAPLLLRLLQVFDVDPSDFSTDGDARLVGDLMEVFGDGLFESEEMSNLEIRELVSRLPAVGNAIVTLYRALSELREQVQAPGQVLQDPLAAPHARLPSDEVTAFIQRHRNYFPTLEDAASSVRHDTDRQVGWEALVRAFEHLGGTVHTVQAGSFGGAVRHYDPSTRRLSLSEVLAPRSRHFHLGVQLGLLHASDELDELADDPQLTTDASRTLARVVLAGYFSGAVLMPYSRFLASAIDTRYDVELLGHRFRASFEQVCHRLCSLHRPGAAGVPFHFIKIDSAGNVSKQFSASGMRFARFGGACPLWNVTRAFMRPNDLCTQVSSMPDGTQFFCIAKTMTRRYGGFRAPQTAYAVGLGCRIEDAAHLVYADAIDLDRAADVMVPVGATCRLCERGDCDQRAFPSLQHPLRMDENVRGVGFYASVHGD